MGAYSQKPTKFFATLVEDPKQPGAHHAYCAGFEAGAWRCSELAFHLTEWLPEYALPEADLEFSHSDAAIKLRQAAIRVYTSDKYQKRGEAGEILLHALCRTFFDTIPISQRVFYKSSSNDVVKAFDLVHARFPSEGVVEIWLGESKLYKDSAGAVSEAIESIETHLDAGFLKNQKLLLGPQIPETAPHRSQLVNLFQVQTSLDALLEASVFVVGIMCDSVAAAKAKLADQPYLDGVAQELAYLNKRLSDSGLRQKARLVLFYVPLCTKDALVQQFDARLKAHQ